MHALLLCHSARYFSVIPSLYFFVIPSAVEESQPYKKSVRRRHSVFRKIYGNTLKTVIFTYTEFMSTFAVRLKEQRKQTGYTQKQLAEKIGTTDDSVYSWEKGRSQPSIELLCELCKVLDVSADYLIGIAEV